MSLLLLDTAFLIDAERNQDALDELIGDDDDVAIAAIGAPSTDFQVSCRLTTARPDQPNRERNHHHWLDGVSGPRG